MVWNLVQCFVSVFIPTKLEKPNKQIRKFVGNEPAKRTQCDHCCYI